MSLTQDPIALLVFHAPGCGACEDLLPKVRERAPAWSSCFPTYLVDVNEQRALADVLQVRSTPTLLLVRYGRAQKLRHEGTMELDELDAFYRKVPGCVLS